MSLHVAGSLLSVSLKSCSRYHKLVLSVMNFNSFGGHFKFFDSASSYLIISKNGFRTGTKYLDHYLGWCNELHNRKISDPLELIKLAFELKTPETRT